MYTILLNLIHEYIFFCSSCCCYCRNKILKIKPTVFLCLHSGGWTGEKNNYCKKTFQTACDMNMAMHAKICLLFCHLVQKKKRNQCLTVSQFDQYAVQISIKQVCDKWVHSSWRNLDFLMNSQSVFSAHGCLTFELNRIQDGFFFKKSNHSLL